MESQSKDKSFKKKKEKTISVQDVQFWDRIKTVALKAPVPVFTLGFPQQDGGQLLELFCNSQRISRKQKGTATALESLFADM